MIKLFARSKTFWIFVAIVMISSTLIGAGFGSPAVGAMVGAGIIFGALGVCILVGLLFWGLIMSFFKR